MLYSGTIEISNSIILFTCRCFSFKMNVELEDEFMRNKNIRLTERHLKKGT